MAELKYEIVKECGVLSQSPSGWTKELNLVSWNDRPAKFDIREWAPDHSRMAKGLTFTAEELGELRRILENLDLPTEDLPD
jgi:hypothetical protein